MNYYSYIRNYAVKIIKKYSHNKDKKNEISSYVQEELNFIEPPQEFALGYPVEVLKVINEGIRKFYVPKKWLQMINGFHFNSAFIKITKVTLVYLFIKFDVFFFFFLINKINVRGFFYGGYFFFLNVRGFIYW